MNLLHDALAQAVTSLPTAFPRHLLAFVALSVTALAAFLVGGAAFLAITQLSVVWLFLPLTVAAGIAEHLPRAVATQLMPVLFLGALVVSLVGFLATFAWSFYATVVVTVACMFPTRFGVWAAFPAGRTPNPLSGLALWALHAAVWGAALVIPVVPVVLAGVVFGLVPPLVAADGLPIHTAAWRLLGAWRRAPGTTLLLSSAALTASVLGCMVPMGPTVAAEFQVRCARHAAAT